MLLFNLSDLRAELGLEQRILGLDLGSKTIGVALSDVSLLLASPYDSIKRSKLAMNAAQIVRIARREHAGALVVGWPLDMDGKMGPAAQAARDWARALSDTVQIATAIWDERLSSAAVNRMLIEEMDLSRRKRLDVVDKLAAAYILQSALDAMK